MSANNFDGILIHYGELALKGDNRSYFENALLQSIRAHFKELPPKQIKKLYGRFYIEAEITVANKSDYELTLRHVFGIANFAFVRRVLPDMNQITNTAIELLNPHLNPPPSLGGGSGGGTFKIETLRSDKRFPLNSMEVNKLIGAKVLEAIDSKAKSDATAGEAPHRHAVGGSGARVNVKNPEATCFIEITTQGVFIYLDKIQGPGGLPTEVSGTMLGFLSGGIDSPVACFRLMSRGVQIIFLHFHSYPQTSRASIDKVKELAEILNKYQLNSKLYLAPFLDIQKQIMINCQADLRVILYRRMMMRIGNEIARQLGAQAIVTGESLGQVASQTIENLAVIEKISETPVLRPLVGSDKNEIIALARKIGTYDISIRPHEDCCQVFLPKHPATKARLENIEKEESKLEIEKLIKEAIKNTEIKLISGGY